MQRYLSPHVHTHTDIHETEASIRLTYSDAVRYTQVKFSVTQPTPEHHTITSVHSIHSSIPSENLLPISCYDPHRITEKTLIYYSQLLTQLNQPTQLIKLSQKATESQQNQQISRKINHIPREWPSAAASALTAAIYSEFMDGWMQQN